MIFNGTRGVSRGETNEEEQELFDGDELACCLVCGLGMRTLGQHSRDEAGEIKAVEVNLRRRGSVRLLTDAALVMVIC